jgi:inorganic pyrophosphatase
MNQTFAGPQAPAGQLEAVNGDTGRVNVVIDTPRGSRCKYKYEERSGLFHLSKLLPLGNSFPYDFGFVPSTRGDDGDALDVLVIVDEPVALGCVVPVRLIGVLEAEQTEGNGKTIRNDRLIGSVETSFNPAELESLKGMNKQRLDEIEHFFISYNEMEGRRFRPLGRHGPHRAERLLHQGMRKFANESRKRNGQADKAAPPRKG